MRKRRRMERILNATFELMTVLVVILFAMAAGAACYHQYLMQHPKELKQYRIETVQQAVTYWQEIPDQTPVQLIETEMTSKMIEEEEKWDELELLAACVEAEAGNQSMEGKRMVADVILNRVRDKDWPDTITGVITQPYQFTTYWNGAIDRADPTEETFEACRMELEEIGWPGIYYFTADTYSEYGTPWKQVGDHYFSTK